MSSLNQVSLIGNVGNDPEIRDLQNGGRVCNFTLATTEKWTDKNTGAKNERTEWHRIVVWNDGLITVISDYVRKGSKLFVQGQNQTRKWQDQNGNDRYTTEVVLNRFGSTLVLLGGNNQQNDDAPPQQQSTPSEQASQPSQTTQTQQQQATEFGDVPF